MAQLVVNSKSQETLIVEGTRDNHKMIQKYLVLSVSPQLVSSVTFEVDVHASIYVLTSLLTELRPLILLDLPNKTGNLRGENLL